MSYYITFDSSGGLTLAHGVEWRRHKYICKEGNRYIYPEDLRKQQAQEAARQAQERGAHKTGRYANQPGGKDAAAERERAADITAQRRRTADNAQASGKKKTEQFKLESAKEHRERLSEGVKDRKNKVLFSRAANSVERFGAKTVKSIADSAKKGANWVSNLFKKKK